MGSFSIWHILFAVVVIALLFGGRGRISGIMGDTAKGIKAFRDGLKSEDEAHEEEPPAKPLPKSTSTKSASAKTTSARGKSKTAG